VVTTLVRSGPPQDQDLDALRTRHAELETTLADRSAELARARADLTAFRIRYRREVGLLHEQLDQLEQAIAAAELGEISRRLQQADGEPIAPPAAQPATSAARLTSDAVRKLFRDVAKAIHPDLALDAETRDRRHSLMIEANRAYALGDEERLRSILETWESSSEAVPGNEPDAIHAHLVRRNAAIEDRLAVIAGELAELKETAIWKLKAMVDDEAARGNNLMADMIRRLRRDIVAARNRLDAMQSHPPR
jgi:hypothetical protein